MAMYLTGPSGPVVERSPGVWEVLGSVLGRVIPKTFKIVLGASLLSARHLKVRYVGFPIVSCKM